MHRLLVPCLGLVLLTAAQAASRAPSIVIILSDDFGYGSSGGYGANPVLVQTPDLDFN